MIEQVATVLDAARGKGSELLSRFWAFLVYSHEDRSLENKIICNLMVISIVICCVSASFTTVTNGDSLISVMTGSIYEYGFMTLAHIILIEITAISMFMVVHFDRKGQIMYARYAVRVAMMLLIASMLSCLAVNGMMFVEYFYLFQFVCLVAYQVFNDPNLSFNAPWYNPLSRKARAAAKEDIIYRRDKYMPLNFFNLFWVFMICSVIGLGIETWYRLFTVGILEDRAGLLWGPFSPIYGFGGALMTIMLNRFWNKNLLVIFAVSALIGAGFEFFVSWYMEIAFGISAWDYSSAFLNIDGRTDLAHAVAWGILGLVWIRFLLPITMRLVDAIKLNWRAIVTSLAFAAMIVNAVMTVMALDAWSMRTEGIPPQSETQKFYAEYFNDEWMESRFQTMTVSRTGSVHSHLLANSKAGQTSGLAYRDPDNFVGPIELAGPFEADEPEEAEATGAEESDDTVSDGEE